MLSPGQTGGFAKDSTDFFNMYGFKMQKLVPKIVTLYQICCNCQSRF